ncbi:MAG: aminotransferase class III-fold pyridoxal phosphate-dependent enzyme, partial [Lapillicoccus sp.]
TDVVPDAVTLAKGLAGGVPIGALVTYGPDVTGLLTGGQHGSTFGGNPLACAAGLATIHTIEADGLLAHAAETGAYLRRAVEGLGHPRIVEVRGRGLLLAVTLSEPVAASAMALAREAGFLVNAVQPDAIRLAPPLILTTAQADTFVAALPSILDVAVPA